MTTTEKLFVQIFERKKSIIHQLKHQTDLYYQNLASKLIIDGVHPPSWLWNPNSHTHSTDPKELNKEELISEILLPHCRPTFPYPSSYYPLYSNQAITGDNGHLSDESFMETHTFQKYNDAGDVPKSVPKGSVNDTENRLNCILELNSRVTSPRDQTGDVILETHAFENSLDAEKTLRRNCNIVTATTPQIQSDLSVSNSIVPEHSLVRIQRSKSRQTALKLRNSENATSRKRFSNEKYLGRLGSDTAEYANVLFESNKHSYANKEICVLGVEKEGSQSKSISIGIYSGRVTRSKSSCKQHGEMDESSKAEISAQVEKKDGNPLPDEDLEQHNNSNRSLELVTDSCVIRDSAEKPSTPNDFPNLENPGGYTGNEIQTFGKVMQWSKDANEFSEFVQPSSELIGRKTRSQTAELVGSSAEFMQKSNGPNELSYFVKTSSDGRKTRSRTAEFIGPSSELMQKSNGPMELPDFSISSSHGRKTSSRMAEVDASSFEFMQKSNGADELPDSVRSSSEFMQNSNGPNELPEFVKSSSDGRKTRSQTAEFVTLSSEFIQKSTGASSFELNGSKTRSETACNNERMSTENLKEQTSNADEPAEAAKSSRKLSGRKTRSQTANTNEEISMFVNHSRSESLVLGFPSGDSMAKQLDFYVAEENNVDNTSCPPFDKEIIEKPLIQGGERETGSAEAGLFNGDLGHLKPKRLELEHDLLSSASKQDSWPQFKRRKVEDHLTNFFSSSPRFTVQKLHTTHVNPESNRCLKNFTNILDVVSPLNENLSYDVGICQPIRCDSPVFQQEETELGFEEKNEGADLRLANTVDQSLTKQFGQDSQGCLVADTKTEAQTTHILTDKYNPLFNLENIVNCVSADGMNAGETVLSEPQSCSFKSRLNTDLNLTGSELEAFILDPETENTSTSTPFSQFSFELNPHNTINHYRTVPNGFLDRMDLHSPMHDENMIRYIKPSYSASRFFGWNSKNMYSSPVGKLWERNSLSSSDKRMTSNPELTCFKIEEDPDIIEENEILDDVAGKVHDIVEREPLSEITEACLQPPVSIAEKFQERDSLDSVSTEVSFAKTRNSAKRKHTNQYSDKRSTNESIEGRNGIKKLNKSLQNRFSKPRLSAKTSVKRGEQRFSEKVPVRSNIVSNITSFVPLVQQKQAAAICTGKRDVKVKALEAAEAAKRLEVKKQNERKMKKEAMQIERARIEQENLRQKELDKKKKEDEQRKRDAEKAARKRLREEEKKEKGRKRNRIEEVRVQVKIKEEKLYIDEVEKEKPYGKKDDKGKTAKESENPKGKGQHVVKLKENEKLLEKSDVGISTSNIEEVVDLKNENDNIMVLDNSVKSAETKIQEKSYEISPYQCSDDEEDDENDIRTKKFIPSWASENCVAVVLSSQSKIDPEVIFPCQSFCSPDEVLLSRKLKAK